MDRGRHSRSQSSRIGIEDTECVALGALRLHRHRGPTQGGSDRRRRPRRGGERCCPGSVGGLEGCWTGSHPAGSPRHDRRPYRCGPSSPWVPRRSTRSGSGPRDRRAWPSLGEPPRREPAGRIGSLQPKAVVRPTDVLRHSSPHLTILRPLPDRGLEEDRSSRRQPRCCSTEYQRRPSHPEAGLPGRRLRAPGRSSGRTAPGAMRSRFRRRRGCEERATRAGCRRRSRPTGIREAPGRPGVMRRPVRGHVRFAYVHHTYRHGAPHPLGLGPNRIRSKAMGVLHPMHRP
jgi:hypothetical protein